MTYGMTIAGLKRELPLCPISDELQIGAFVIFGDVELTVAAAAELLKKAPDFDYMVAPEAKAIPLIHEMARQSGAEKYFLQHFKDSGNCIRNDLHEVDEKTALEYKAIAEKKIRNVRLRGY